MKVSEAGKKKKKERSLALVRRPAAAPRRTGAQAARVGEAAAAAGSTDVEPGPTHTPRRKYVPYDSAAYSEYRLKALAAQLLTQLINFVTRTARDAAQGKMVVKRRRPKIGVAVRVPTSGDDDDAFGPFPPPSPPSPPPPPSPPASPPPSPPPERLGRKRRRAVPPMLEDIRRSRNEDKRDLGEVVAELALRNDALRVDPNGYWGHFFSPELRHLPAKKRMLRAADATLKDCVNADNIPNWYQTADETVAAAASKKKRRSKKSEAAAAKEEEPMQVQDAKAKDELPTIQPTAAAAPTASADMPTSQQLFGSESEDSQLPPDALQDL